MADNINQAIYNNLGYIFFISSTPFSKAFRKFQKFPKPVSAG
jgi:hypothetical protein